MSARPRVLVAEDNILMADAIASWVSRTCEVVGCVHELGTLQATVATTRPDVVLLDLAFADESALLRLPEFAAAAPDTRFIILTAYAEEALMRSAFEAGAWGFVMKSSDFNEILHAIAEVMAGRTYRSPGIKSITRPRPSKRGVLPVDTGSYQPTPRQVRMLRLVRSGMTLRAAGKRMGYHHKTIEYHVKAVQVALGLATRDQLMQWVDEHLQS